ncbi:MAG TPA: Rieske 2Fe-2S domain-containing protein [Ideonella sp.]|nr:Rieske 2Fe-2S domain-containing protein [Ideonella sp.]
MSDALAFLARARPDAMGPYFQFLRQCGRHLDPKTRLLISVITKVHAQTERGLRQYVQRALREGCTPAELLDALLMAFPALGLTRIVWAVDVMLSMNLPGFDAETLAGDASWHDLIALHELPPGATRRVECDGRGVYVHHGEGGPLVWDSRCPHQGTDIPPSGLQGTTLTCPGHHRAFDLASGKCSTEGGAPLARRDCRVVDGRVQARW